MFIRIGSPYYFHISISPPTEGKHINNLHFESKFLRNKKENCLWDLYSIQNDIKCSFTFTAWIDFIDWEYTPSYLLYTLLLNRKYKTPLIEGHSNIHLECGAEPCQVSIVRCITVFITNTPDSSRQYPQYPPRERPACNNSQPSTLHILHLETLQNTSSVLHWSREHHQKNWAPQVLNIFLVKNKVSSENWREKKSRLFCLIIQSFASENSSH